MKPTEHTRANVAVVDVAPGPLKEFRHDRNLVVFYFIHYNIRENILGEIKGILKSGWERLFGIVTTSPTASPGFARSVCDKMPFLCRSTKKGRKKGNQRLPPLETAALPLYKENRGEKHKSLLYIARHLVTTSGRYGEQKVLRVS
jgi:hypothetical protein